MSTFPATSEIVIEGELVPGERRTEGPFGVPRLLSGGHPAASFQIESHHASAQPDYLTALTGPPTTDNHVMKEVILEAILYDRLRQICPTLRDVCVTKGGVNLHAVVSMRPTFISQARDIMLACFSTERIRPKLVVVVDDDIDPRDPVMVEWAIATRFQADQDLVVLPRQVGAPLDPRRRAFDWVQSWYRCYAPLWSGVSRCCGRSRRERFCNSRLDGSTPLVWLERQ